jgi:drug/metabolite transporter (DMT)-like permease
MNPLFYVAASILFNTCSHLFLKKGVVKVANLPFTAPSVSLPQVYSTQPAIWIGILLNGIAAFFWLIALSIADLSYAFPFLSINYILIPLGAHLLFKERISRLRLFGIIVICSGVLVIALG